MSTSDKINLVVSDESQVQVYGLGIATAAIFLAGEMAGSGVLALSSAVVQTGWLLIFININNTVLRYISQTPLYYCNYNEWSIVSV